MNPVLALAISLSAPATIDEPTPQLRAAPAFYTARISKTVDVNQHMTWEQLLMQLPARLQSKYTPPAEIGKKSRVFYENFCGPCAVSDNLMYLRNFYPQIGEHSNSVASGAFLARDLGSNYLGTLSEPDSEDFDPVTGTGTSIKNLVKGTLDYLKKKNVPVKKVTVISVWSPKYERKDYGHPGTNIQLLSRAPSTKEMKDALRLKSLVVSHYGHYEYNPNPTRLGSKGKSLPYLLRTGGHYVAPVGYGKDSKGKSNLNMFIVNDPAGSYQYKQAQVYTEWVRQPKGKHQSLPMLNDRRKDGGVRSPKFNYPAKPGFERLGSLSQTYVMSPALSNPKKGKRVEVMESLVVIQF